MPDRKLEKDRERKEAIFSHRESSEARAPTPCLIRQPLSLEGQTLRLGLLSLEERFLGEGWFLELLRVNHNAP
jgi:hypothetical protein